MLQAALKVAWQPFVFQSLAVIVVESLYLVKSEAHTVHILSLLLGDRKLIAFLGVLTSQAILQNNSFHVG